MTRSAHHISALSATAVSLLLMCVPATLVAQTAANSSNPSANSISAQYQAHIDAAISQLQTLDQQAEACLSAFNSNSSSSNNNPATSSQNLCKEFLNEVDGSGLSNYLAHCDALKSWRDSLVSNSQTDDPSVIATEDQQATLQLLLGVEFACGEGALQKRTVYVSDTFNLLYGQNTLNQQSTATLNRRLNELQFEATLNRERQLLQDSLRQAQRQRLQQTDQQFDDLENEILRQQINN